MNIPSANEEAVGSANPEVSTASSPFGVRTTIAPSNARGCTVATGMRSLADCSWLNAYSDDAGTSTGAVAKGTSIDDDRTQAPTAGECVLVAINTGIVRPISARWEDGKEVSAAGDREDRSYPDAGITSAAEPRYKPLAVR